MRDKSFRPIRAVAVSTILATAAILIHKAINDIFPDRPKINMTEMMKEYQAETRPTTGPADNR
jgi:hypothetical protein